jgi:CRISPR/Cas system-associated exonuclease Cas4 (RecB family)
MPETERYSLVLSFRTKDVLRRKVMEILRQLRVLGSGERMPGPPPPKLRNRCVDCEFLNYCGDVF